MQEVIEGLADHQASRTDPARARRARATAWTRPSAPAAGWRAARTTMALELVVLTLHGETRAGHGERLRAAAALRAADVPVVAAAPRHGGRRRAGRPAVRSPTASSPRPGARRRRGRRGARAGELDARRGRARRDRPRLGGDHAVAPAHRPDARRRVARGAGAGAATRPSSTPAPSRTRARCCWPAGCATSSAPAGRSSAAAARRRRRRGAGRRGWRGPTGRRLRVERLRGPRRRHGHGHRGRRDDRATARSPSPTPTARGCWPASWRSSAATAPSSERSRGAPV